MLFFYLLILSQLNAADSFPTGCLAEKSNLEQACKMMKKVKSTDTLVFATGETMRGCFLMTKNPEETVDRNKFDRLSFLVHQLLLEKTKISNPSDFSFYLENPQALVNLASVHKFKKADFELIQSYISAFPPELKVMDAKKIDFEKEFESSQAALLGILKSKVSDPKASRSLSEVVSSISPSDSKDSSPDSLSCQPDTNAFFSPNSRQISFQGGTSQYPAASRRIILGHELAHSIDGPRYSLYIGGTKHPLAGLIECLREGSGKFKQREEVENKIGTRHTNEAFCDHIGSELVAEYLKTNPPKYRFVTAPVPAPTDQVFLPPGYEILTFEIDAYCSSSHEENDSHPNAYKRFREIFLRNPTIAKAFNCPTNQQECDLNGAVKPSMSTPTKKVKEDPSQGQK